MKCLNVFKPPKRTGYSDIILTVSFGTITLYWRDANQEKKSCPFWFHSVLPFIILPEKTEFKSNWYNLQLNQSIPFSLFSQLNTTRINTLTHNVCAWHICRLWHVGHRYKPIQDVFHWDFYHFPPLWSHSSPLLISYSSPSHVLLLPDSWLINIPLDWLIFDFNDVLMR